MNRNIAHAHAAVDLGASSGRVILGWVEDGTLHLEEAHRFDNIQKRIDGHDCWDIDGLFDQVVEGLRRCKSELGVVPETIGIDTWGSDFVLLDEHLERVGEAVAYRDARAEGMAAVADSLFDKDEAFARTGIQEQFFNACYHLLGLKRQNPEQLEQAAHFTQLPDYLNLRLTGVLAHDYTNATLTGLVNAHERTWDDDIIEAFGLPRRIFGELAMPGGILGPLLPEIAERVGYQAPVVLVVTHDNASAWLAVPAHGNAVFLSSGTWCILGSENLPEPVCTREARLAGFTNEGGYQYRHEILRNIAGMWMIQSVRREVNGVSYVEGRPAREAMFDHKVGFGELIDMAREAEDFEAHLDFSDSRFDNPESMIDEIRAACRESGQRVPETIGEIMRTIYLSLARTYADGIAGLSELTGIEYDSISMVGGGSQDAYLNQLTANACKLPVHAGPTECTCLGNLMLQLMASGEISSVEEGRALIERSSDIVRFGPEGAL